MIRVTLLSLLFIFFPGKTFERKQMIRVTPLPKAWSRLDEPDFFHPSIAELDDGTWLMTMQRKPPVDDIYGPPEFALSVDRGAHWSAPAPIPGMEYRETAPGIIRNVADIRVFSSPDRKSALVIGVTSYYRGDKRLPPAEHTAKTPKQPMYAFFHRDTGWSPARLLDAGCFPPEVHWRAACTQIVWQDDSIILPVYFTERHGHFAARTLKLARDGDTLRATAWGAPLAHDFGRGFMEPSAVGFRDRYYLTLRAEDGHGHWCVSDDGLNWSPARIWRFDDGTPLETSTTQQHWLRLGDQLCLVYTRRRPENEHVMRWRSPLLVAVFDPDAGCLRRDSERVVFPYQERDGLYNRMGNFHAAELPGGRGVVSVGALYAEVQDGRILRNFSEVCIAELNWNQP